MTEGSSTPTVATGRRFTRERFVRPIAVFVNTEASSGIVLLIAAAAALVWANSPWEESYFDLWHTTLSLDVDLFSIETTLGHAVNDGLMAIFFFVVGLEIKRELVHGELSTVRKASLPVAAAAGGMVIPALLYTVVNFGGEGERGWGIPMATDIAFAMGVLALLGKRAPFSLKVFLLALAIVDDLGAIVVIAVFYSDSISIEAVAWAGAIVAGIIIAGRSGVRSTAVYLVLGVVFWVAVFKSGVHATVAGVILAALTPSRPFYTPQAFEAGATDLLASYEEAKEQGQPDTAQQALREFEELTRGTESPLDRLEHKLHPWVSYGIVPVFALANAGVAFTDGLFSDAAGSAISMGVIVGLVVGKPVGILLACLIMVKLKLAHLPADSGFGHLIGVGLLAGIGFTVSLFIAGLAFDDPGLTDEAKIGILAASAVAGIVGFVYLFFLPGEPSTDEDVEEELVEAPVNA